MGQGVTSEAYKLFMKLKNNCRAVEGNFTLLWHGSNLIDPAGVELYRSVLED